MTSKTRANKKRKDALESSRERTDPNPNDNPLALDVRNFGTEAKLNEFTKVCGRKKVGEERAFPQDVLDTALFSHEINLKEWGWFHLLQDDSTRVLTDVVKVFYYNSEVKKDHYRFKYLGRYYKLTFEEILKELDITTVGTESINFPRNFNFLEATRFLLGDPRAEACIHKAKYLPLATRILHQVLTQVFNPRQGNFSMLYRIDCYHLYQIAIGKPFNLHDLVLANINRGIEKIGMEKNREGLPYGKLLTKLLSKKIPVNLEDVSAPFFLEPLNLGNIQAMGWKWSDDDYGWVRKEELEALNEVDAQDADFDPDNGEEEGEENEEDNDDANEDADDEEMPQAGGGNEDLVARFDRLEARFNNFEATVARNHVEVRDDMKTMMEEQRRHYEKLYGYFDAFPSNFPSTSNPFPPPPPNN